MSYVNKEYDVSMLAILREGRGDACAQGRGDSRRVRERGEGDIFIHPFCLFICLFFTFFYFCSINIYFKNITILGSFFIYSLFIVGCNLKIAIYNIYCRYAD